MTFRQWFCKHVCPCPSDGVLSPHPAADEVRKASHQLNNAAFSLQGAVHNITKQADALEALVRIMQGEKK